MTRITALRGREIIDSRGNPTVEADVQLESGAFGRAAVPSGASTGSREAVELRDGGDRYLGKGVQNAVANLNNEVAAALLALGDTDQSTIDQRMIELDGTDNKLVSARMRRSPHHWRLLRLRLQKNRNRCLLAWARVRIRCLSR